MVGPSGHKTMPLVVGMIPARLASTRFPAKVLANETGRPLVQHVWENATRSKACAKVVIATDHQDVRTACETFGAEVVMTRPDHPNGTSRLEEGARLLGLSPDAIVVNVQGDEPELEPELIDAVVEACVASGAEVATIASPFAPGEDPANPAVVKVVRAESGLALYFSRSVIPFPRDATACQPLRHVGLYAYRVGFLQTYVTLKATPLERSESLEQLRVLEHGYRIAVALRTSTSTKSRTR